jgi:hypothetical protein
MLWLAVAGAIVRLSVALLLTSAHRIFKGPVGSILRFRNPAFDVA